MKMSSTFKNRQVKTFGGFLLRFSSLLFILTKPEKFFIRAFSMKMSSTYKNRQVRTFGEFLIRFSSLLYYTEVMKNVVGTLQTS